MSNLFFYFQWMNKPVPAGLENGGMARAGVEPATAGGPAESRLAAGDSDALGLQVERLQRELDTQKALVESSQNQIARLENEKEAVALENQRWQAQYQRLTARLMPFFESGDGMSRYTVIEMVDEASFASDAPRRGLAEIAGQFLTGPGNVVSAELGITGPEVTDREVATASAKPGASDDASFNRLDDAPASESREEAGSSGQGSGSDVTEPLAFTVWSDDEQQGFLDIYNMPEMNEGEVAKLWVRAGELDPFLQVGEIPQLEDGSGSVFYSVEEANFTPSQILITRERADIPVEAPSGDIILRGP